MKVCKTCGRVIDDETDMIYEVNPNLEDAFIECESCHDDSWENNRIIHCDMCGCWFTPNHIKDDPDSRIGFTPCPACGLDIVEGVTREEMLQEIEPLRYAAIVRYYNGYQRGYIVYAQDIAAMMKLLMKRVDMRLVSAIEFSEVICDDDILRGDEYA